ncbi:helix-turn-helix transcriptional regulator [Nocardia sp. CC227C]|uniref:helix-turn-helix domain-containing protein n=1 Tax=Nocardia sp. CC227C TaxID=3044562 RepID=UPI00278BFEEE|nr:helix-turn-helix transcriptional regulator [Nocardia sp. CC227C]
MELHELSQRQMAAEIGLNPSTITLWFNDAGRTPDRKAVRAIAEKFGRPISEVLIKAGYATAEELGMSADRIDPLTDAELIQTLRERLDRLRALERQAADNAAHEPTTSHPAADQPPKTVKTRRALPRRD